MMAGIPLLQTHAEQIAATAAEVDDQQQFIPVLTDIVRQMAVCMSKSTTARPTLIDISSLSKTDLSEHEIARLLRRLLFASIELFRAELDPSCFSDAVCALRSCVHDVIPRSPISEKDREFFGRLIQDGQYWDNTACQRLYQLFHDVTFTINDIIYIHDLNGTLLYVNPPGLALAELSTEDLLHGLSIYDLIVPEFLELIEARLEMPGAVSRAPYTSEIYTKTGARIPFELTTRVFQENGDTRGVIGLARDLRLARRLEVEIRRAHAHLDTLSTYSPTGILLLDQAGAILDANPAAAGMLGAPSISAIVGMSFFAVCPVEAATFSESMSKAMKRPQGVLERIDATTSFGATLMCEIRMAPVKYDPPTPYHIMFLMTDISQQVALQRNLVEREKLTALGEVLSGVAHEINNPLTVILGYAQLLLMQHPTEEARERLDHIVIETSRCRRIIQNLFSFAQHYEAAKAMHNVNDLLTDLLSLREYQLRINGVKVELSLEKDLPPIHVDGYEVQRVFLSIINNAQQALTQIRDGEKRLTIETFYKAGNVYIRFSDNGPGIPEAILPRIFEPFFTTRGIGGGVGLGLSVAHGIIREHGGRILVDSKEGEGAAFTVMLPQKH